MAPQQDPITVLGGPSRWQLDSTRTEVAVTHKTLWGMVTVKGRFTDVTGEGELLEGGAVQGALRIGADSLDTGHAGRDKHLRSADFFDVERFPAITVRVVSGTLGADRSIDLLTEVAVREIREPVTVRAELTELTAGSVAFDVATRIDRGRFGLTWNRLRMMSGDTGVTVHAVFTRV